MEGYLRGVYEKAIANKETNEEQNQEYGLIVADKKQKVEQAMHDKYKQLKTDRNSRKVRDAKAYYNGKDKGKKYSFNRGVNQRETRKLN